MHTIEIRRKSLAWAADLVVACKSTDASEGAILIADAFADCSSEMDQEILSEALSAVCRSTKHASFVPYEDWSSLMANALYAAMWVKAAEWGFAAKADSDHPKGL